MRNKRAAAQQSRPRAGKGNERAAEQTRHLLVMRGLDQCRRRPGGNLGALGHARARRRGTDAPVCRPGHRHAEQVYCRLWSPVGRGPEEQARRGSPAEHRGGREEQIRRGHPLAAASVHAPLAAPRRTACGEEQMRRLTAPGGRRRNRYAAALGGGRGTDAPPSLYPRWSGPTRGNRYAPGREAACGTDVPRRPAFPRPGIAERMRRALLGEPNDGGEEQTCRPQSGGGRRNKYAAALAGGGGTDASFLLRRASGEG